MGSIRAITLPVHQLAPDQRDAMWRVFEAYYAGAARERFDRDLDEKDHVILLQDGVSIRGFSTVVVERVDLAGRVVISVFSGDTVLDRAYHGQTALQWAFFTYIVKTKLRHPHRTVVWFLISKGYKTYLLLARNFVTFFPRRDRPTQPWADEVIRTLASRRFGDALDVDRGVLHFEADHERLREDVAPTDGLDDPDIRFFEAANPGHADGDELCCIGVVDAKLLLSYPLKVFRKRA